MLCMTLHYAYLALFLMYDVCLNMGNTGLIGLAVLPHTCLDPKPYSDSDGRVLKDHSGPNFRGALCYFTIGKQGES